MNLTVYSGKEVRENYFRKKHFVIVARYMR